MDMGLIAGGGQLPLLFARAAAEKNIRIHAAAYVNEADASLSDHVATVEWLHLGQVNRLIRYFKKMKVTQAVMLGTVKKTRIFSDIKPDLKALTFIAGMAHTHDDSVLTSFANLLEKNGIIIKPSTWLLPELISEKGCWTRRKPNRAEKKDMAVGWALAREIGRLDIGQCVVVANGTALAVEAADGTDATIRRGGALGRGGAVLVKRAKPDQDLRFDLPSSGLETVTVMHESGVTVLVVEAGKSIAFDKGEMIRYADSHGISIVALEDGDL